MASCLYVDSAVLSAERPLRLVDLSPPPLPCWWPWCGNVGVGCSLRWVGLFPPVTFDGPGGVAARRRCNIILAMLKIQTPYQPPHSLRETR